MKNGEERFKYAEGDPKEIEDKLNTLLRRGFDVFIIRCKFPQNKCQVLMKIKRGG